ncbi:MAG: hypothetical protein HPY50_04605 [Firmicutes bacterium]|nr:hypothetical protein [Bacillota bacterium]
MEMLLYLVGAAVMIVGVAFGLFNTGAAAPGFSLYITILGILSGVFFVIMGEVIRQLKLISRMLKDVLEGEESKHQP